MDTRRTRQPDRGESSRAGSARGREKEKKGKKYRANTALHFHDYTKPGDPGVARISRVP